MTPIPEPYCPKCTGKPRLRQRALTPAQRSSLKGNLARSGARFDALYLCNVCEAVYAFQDGFSTFLGHLPVP